MSVGAVVSLHFLVLPIRHQFFPPLITAERTLFLGVAGTALDAAAVPGYVQNHPGGPCRKSKKGDPARADGKTGGNCRGCLFSGGTGECVHDRPDGARQRRAGDGVVVMRLIRKAVFGPGSGPSFSGHMPCRHTCLTLSRLPGLPVGMILHLFKHIA